MKSEFIGFGSSILEERGVNYPRNFFKINPRIETKRRSFSPTLRRSPKRQKKKDIRQKKYTQLNTEKKLNCKSATNLSICSITIRSRSPCKRNSPKKRSKNCSVILWVIILERFCTKVNYQREREKIEEPK